MINPTDRNVMDELRQALAPILREVEELPEIVTDDCCYQLSRHGVLGLSEFDVGDLRRVRLLLDKIDALSAKTGESVVKQLAWRQSSARTTFVRHFSAEIANDQYYEVWEKPGEFWWCAPTMIAGRRAASLEEAFAAAQTHFEAAIRSALSDAVPADAFKAIEGESNQLREACTKQRNRAEAAEALINKLDNLVAKNEAAFQAAVLEWRLNSSALNDGEQRA